MIILENETNGNEITSFWDLKNASQLRDELIEMLKKFDIDKNEYDTDVYLYVHPDMTGELDTFLNPGGNSWLDDDHYVLYTDKQRYSDWTDDWTSLSEIADYLDMTEDELKAETLSYIDPDGTDYDIDDIGYSDVVEYFNDERQDYINKLNDYMTDYIENDLASYYYDKADSIIDYFDENLDT